MNHENHPHHGDGDSPPSFWRTRYAIGLLVFGAIALVFLLAEHRAHLLGALPFLLLAACPFMHVFMHHGHGSHDHSRTNATGDRDAEAPASGESTDATHRHDRGARP